MQATEYREFVGLQQYWFVLRRRWLPAATVLGLVVIFTVLVTSLQKPVYRAKGKLLFKRNDSTSVVTALGQASGELDILSQQSNPTDREAEVVGSVPIAQETIAALQLKDRHGVSLEPEELLKRFDVKSIKGADVLQLSYESKTPEEAAAVVNLMMNLYLKSNVLSNRTEAMANGEFIEKQLPKTEATVRQAEAALRLYKQRNKIVDLDKEAESAVEVIGDLEKQINTARVQLEAQNARSAALQNKVGMNSQRSLLVSSLSQSPGVQKVLEELQNVDSELKVKRTLYQENHPTIANLKDQEAALRTVLRERTGQILMGQKQEPDRNLQIGELKQKLNEQLVDSEVERIGLARQVTALSNEQFIYKQRVNTLPELQQGQRELERQMEAAQSTYEALLKKLQEIRVAENQNVANARIIEAAIVPKKPVSPHKALNFSVGGLLGISLAIATTLILEVRDSSIKTVEKARELFGYPLLGTIPAFKKTEKVTPGGKDREQAALEIPIRDTPGSPICEAYRMLQVNLSFLSSDKKLKVIVVTSSVAKEGKSTTSASLAVAIAQLGHRVLLVDADMRRPAQHQIWQLSNKVGLSNIITGQAGIKTTIKECMANLSVLTSGVSPPNPLALVASERMAALIKHFSDNYDFVIIDTPPVAAAADAHILGKMADGVLLVIRLGAVDSASATAAKSSLEQSGQNILGLAVNGVMAEYEADSYHYTRKYYAKEDFTSLEKVMFKNYKKS